MILTVFLHELRQLARERVALAAVLVLMISLLAGLGTGSSLHRKQEEVRAGVQAQTDQHFKAMRAQLEAVAAGRKPEGFFFANRPTAIRYYVPRPVSPLTPLSLGRSELLPASASVSLFNPESSTFEMSSIDNPENQQIGRFDTSFVLIFILPLLLISLTYNVLSSERERGTLPLLLNQPVALWRLLMSKAAVPFLLLTIPAVVVPVLWVVLGNQDAASHWPNLLFFAALVSGYSFFWMALAVIVNLIGFRSSTNALLLGSSWLIFVLALPAALQAGLSTLYPVPSRLELVSQARTAEVENASKRKQIVDRFYQDHPELVPAGGKENRVLGFYATFLETEKAVNPVYQRFESQLAAQQAWVGRLQFISPAVVFQEGLTSAAGTGPEGIEAFRRQTLGFRKEVRDFILSKVVSSRELQLADYDAAPVFRGGRSESGPLPWPALAGLWLPALAVVFWALRRTGSIEAIMAK